MTGAQPQSLTARVSLRLGALALEVDLEAAAGELVVLVGPNGAGKTTLLRALAGLLPIDAGRIAIGDAVLDDPSAGLFVTPADRAIGVVFQDGLLFDHLDVAANVSFGLRCRRVPAREARRRAREWLNRLDLDDELARLRPAQLSGGQAQRVGLARALVFEPRLVLLDEPFAALDATTRGEIRRTIRDHLDALAVPKIVVTHDPVEAMVLADRVVVLEGGRVTQQGPPAMIRAQPRSRYVADLVGINLLRGVLTQGVVTLPEGQQIVVPTRDVPPGPVLLTIHPHAVTLHAVTQHAGPPGGSARNTWRGAVADLDDRGDRVRVRLGRPLPLVAEVTPAACRDLGLAPGVEVWAACKATEIGVQPD